MPELTTQRFTHYGAKIIPRFGFRRLFSDGDALWRLEIGIGFELRASFDSSQAMHLISDVLQLPIRVRLDGKLAADAPLIQQGEAIETALSQACTFKGMPEAARGLRLRRGREMVLVETNAATAELAATEVAAAVPGSRRFSIGADEPASRIDVEYATLRLGRGELPLVWLHSRWQDNAKRVSAVRTSLLRLHAEREVLTQVLRAAKRGLLAQATPKLEQYFSEAQTNLFAKSRYGVEQTRLQEIFAVYDEIAPAERQALENVLQARKQSQQRVLALAGSYSGPDNRPILVLPGGQFNMSDNSVHIGGGNYGPINVAGTFINTGKIISGAPDSNLKTALETLHQLSTDLASKLPLAADKEDVANNAEALTKAALAAKPNKSLLEVTGKGLVDAAKAVAEMAGPIATAVGAVLGILAL